MADTFKSVVDIMGIKAPTTKPSREVWHETQPGFGVRIMKARADGTVRRTYISRVQRMVPHIGYWCYKHDLRRTFASIGATIDPASVLSLSLLLLHSSKTVSKALGIPQITVEYIKGQQRSMRALTEKITQAVLELAGERERTPLTENLREYEDLPQHIESALALEEKAPTRRQDVDGDEDDVDDEDSSDL